MGIVVAVFMFLGLLMALPGVLPMLRIPRLKPTTVNTLATGLLFAGLWNSLWYGLRHIGEFWGQSAVISGSLMISVAVLLLVEQGADRWRQVRFMVRAHAVIKPLRIPLVIGLALCFALYALALVRLNLGLSVPG